MILLSIDPGYERLGIAVIEKVGRNRETLLFSECFKTSAKLPHHERLSLIGKRIEDVIKRYKPESLAVETLFFSSNQKTAMSVSEARGVILYVASTFGLQIFEYKPIEIKVAVTGYGRSEKRQVISMVEKLIDMKSTSTKVSSITKSDDEYDAIAIGLTHFAITK